MNLLRSLHAKKVFPYGWLSPQGEFIKVSHAKHEFMVRETTGFSDCDSACDAAGWVKFTVGLPYNHEGRCLFEADSDKSKLTSIQKTWLNVWLDEISEASEERPTF